MMQPKTSWNSRGLMPKIKIRLLAVELGLVIALMSVIAPSPAIQAKVVEYDLAIGCKTVNFTGRDRTAMTINGRIPGPTLYFTEGDRAVIHARNDMDVETSLHWHGILLPNQYDGVPYVTTMPILPGKSHTFTFDLRQSGTYWYHSHTNLQEQKGLYGAIVIYPRETKIKVDHDIALVLSDWTDESTYEVLRTLKRASEWYSIKKGTAQSWDRVISHHAVKDRLMQSFMRMPPMDISDVYYDRFLINGRPSLDIEGPRAGETVRLRVINGSTSTYFYLQFAAGPLKVISADGQMVEPVYADRVPIAVAETYDFIVTVPKDGAYELRATAQDGSGFASAFIGRGAEIRAPDVPRPNLFKMFTKIMSEMDHGSMSGHKAMRMDNRSKPGKARTPGRSGDLSGAKMTTGEDEPNAREGTGILNYSMLRATRSTRLPNKRPTREIVLELTGNMDRYIWSFNNKTLSEADKILIRRGENVRFVLRNKTMMHHPMHLHGHFFRVLNGRGDYAPLKHTVDVAPMKTTVMEFPANEDKDWFFHCHILYHLAAGMARVVHYEGSIIDPALAEAKKKSIDEMNDYDFFIWGEASAMTHMNNGYVLLSNTRNGIEFRWDSDWEGAYETEPYYVRYVTRLFHIFAGGDVNDEESAAVLGVRYILPFYIASELRVDNDGNFRFEAGNEIQLMPRLFFQWFVNTDDEWRYGVEYMVSKRFSVVANHDSDYDAGMGIRVRF